MPSKIAKAPKPALPDTISALNDRLWDDLTFQGRMMHVTIASAYDFKATLPEHEDEVNARMRSWIIARYFPKLNALEIAVLQSTSQNLGAALWATLKDAFKQSPLEEDVIFTEMLAFVMKFGNDTQRKSMLYMYTVNQGLEGCFTRKMREKYMKVTNVV
ncbi:hypothetical protein BU16DRAFT_561302 [Lophium mytilinum]|uniref:Uncharacterized protein n=1 Tax=Lophium mytilinum TaxID=390894 RepID=A0A6A6QZD5_9PEZI|nr:hypothetical protein BU16DRAFT_561302 [Lophium mytilinum]